MRHYIEKIPTNVESVKQISLFHSNSDQLGLLCCCLPTSSAISNEAEESRSHHFDLANPRSSKVKSCRKRKNVVPRSMVKEAFMGCEAGARASIRPPKALSSFGKHPGNLARLPLQLDSRREKYGGIQKSTSSSKTSRFSPVVLAHKGSALPWLVDDQANLHPRRIWCSNSSTRTLSGFLRQYPLPLACRTLPKDTTSAEALLVKPYRQNQAATACQPTD